MVKKFFIIIAYLFTLPVFAGSINSAIYKSMTPMSYRNNYGSQVPNKVIPYWQAQSNYATRNRMYQSYNDYNNYNNSVNQFNYNVQMNRRRY